jgi:hypothetical protein
LRILIYVVAETSWLIIPHLLDLGALGAAAQRRAEGSSAAQFIVFNQLVDNLAPVT